MKIVKYFFVGGLAAVVDIGLFYLGAGVAGWNYLIVGTVSFTIATLVNYVISVRASIQRRSTVGLMSHARRATLFPEFSANANT